MKAKEPVIRLFYLVLCFFSFALPMGAQDHQRRNHEEMHRLHQDSDAYIAMLEDSERDGYQKPEQVVEALDLRQGEVIADIGSGSGYFSVRFARAVGPRGRVIGVDVNPDMIAHLNRRAHEAGLHNLQTILAPPDDPLLPPAGVDRVFICNTWHHIESQADYLAHIREALRPGGQLIIVDFVKKELPLGPDMEMKIARDDVVSSIERAGFELIQEPIFLPYQYFLIFAAE